MNASDFRLSEAARSAYRRAGGVVAKFRISDAVVAVKGPGAAMQPEPRHLGRVCFVKGVHLFRGDTEHHYSVVFSDGSTDSVDESCLRR